MLPTDRVRAHLMLADYATVVDGKLYLSGGGWTRTRSAEVISAIGGVIIIPWRRLGGNIEIRLSMVQGDGEPIVLEGPQGGEPFVATAVIDARHPPKLPRGADASAPFAASFTRSELEPGSYAFTISEDADGEIARLPFEVDP